MYFAIAAAICFAVFFLTAAAGYSLLCVFARHIRRWAQQRSPRMRAFSLLVASLAPSVAALLVTLAVALPAFLLYEPPWAGERIGIVLPLLAAAGVALVSTAVVQLARLQWTTWRVGREWQRCSRPLSAAASGVSVKEVVVPGALLGTVGLLRPQVYASPDVLAAFTENELQAALAHEAGHVRSADNLKRLLLAAAPGLKLLDRALGLGVEWSRACEVAADEAALRSGVAAVDLASALVKAGRLRFNRDAARVVAASHLVAPSARSEVEERVRRLMQCLDRGPSPQPTATCAWAYTAMGSAALVAYAIYFLPLMHSAHELLERLVR